MDGVGLLADRLKYYRAEQQVVLATETEKRLRARGVTGIRLVPPKVALPLIEAASVEDDPDLMKLWAELLANAMDPAKPKVDKKLVSILQELTADDANLLAAIFADAAKPRERNYAPGVLYSNGFDIQRDARIAAISLYRLGLVAPAEITFDVAYETNSRREEPIKMGERVTVPGTMDVVTLTTLGVAFCEAAGLAGGARE